MLIFKVIFIVSIFALFYSYLIYPFILQIFNFFSSKKGFHNPDETALPFVSIIMAAYNEEEVIYQKVTSVFNSKYPSDKFEMWIGSDNSTDRTNQILNDLSQTYPNLYVICFQERQGKKNIMNRLVDNARGDIIISTDANVIFSPHTIPNLIKNFADPTVGLVDSMMTHHGIVPTGISFQESSYILREVKIKHFEGSLWGSMMGPFGGCFAIRKSLYTKVPANFLMDDFYICMGVLAKGYKTMNSIEAIVTEDVSNQIAEEFKRKIRIAAGNFQNLQAYSFLLNPFRKKIFVSPLAISFCFISHKLIRWFGPFFIISIALTGLAVLNSPILLSLYILFFFTILMIPADFLLKKAGIHTTIIRFSTHFYSSNLALLLGLIKYLKGVKTNVWQPTKRNQSQI